LADENLGSTKLPGILRKAGYPLVTHKTKYKGQCGIKDPQIIADCGKDNLILLTADADLETRWAPEIQKAKIAVVILANNTEGAAVWGARLTVGKKDILAKLQQFPKPCALRFGVNAKVTSVRLYGPKRGKVIKI
jgi:predicted nuclease of predicted toxin-antitoxin system